MGTIVIVVIVIFVALFIIGVVGKSNEKNKLAVKKKTRDDLEFSEFEAALSKKINYVKNAENNLLLTIYPSWVDLLGVNENGEVHKLDPSYPKKTIVSSNFETEINEINEELNGNFTYKFNIPTDLEVKNIEVETRDLYHVLEFIDYLEEGIWVVAVSEYSKKTGLKIYVKNMDNQDEEISYDAAVLIKKEAGVNLSITLSTECITERHEVKHLLKK